MATLEAPNKHQQKTEATKLKLLKAARRVFARDGFEAASIDDIATDAGYTRGAFYAHFETKEDLFFAMMEQRAAVRTEELRSKMEAAAEGSARLRVLREFYASSVTDRQWGLLALEFKLYAARRGKLRAALAARQRSIREKIKLRHVEDLMPRELQCGQESTDRRRILLEAALSGLMLERAFDPDRMDENGAKEVLKGIFDFAIEL